MVIITTANVVTIPDLTSVYASRVRHTLNKSTIK